MFSNILVIGTSVDHNAAAGSMTLGTKCANGSYLSDVMIYLQ